MLLLFLLWLVLYYLQTPIVVIPHISDNTLSVSNKHIKQTKNTDDKNRKILLKNTNILLFDNNNNSFLQNSEVNVNILNYDNTSFYIIIFKQGQLKKPVLNKNNIAGDNLSLNTSDYTKNTLLLTKSSQFTINIAEGDKIKVVFPNFYNVVLKWNYFKNKENRYDGVLLNNNITNIVDN